ncbi:Hypothetical protein R9X50_00159600 [Acrodontium crateriforme]|uniref:CENP-V/GFA domain-containing protein n=1 Tax=Acrodontium crateriforme TaxID=150365 RepID=A0AAQ3R801_9PEZI|nr:Hypothetical protein R9X50_00159600 [Acrodontium crateriforme]
MPSGSCMCGEITISYSGEPKYTAICHCNDDRKIGNIVVYQIDETKFQITSDVKPKEWTMKSDFGRDITNHFCATCGTVMFRTGGSPSVKGLVGLRAGVLDDQNTVNNSAPMMEVYVERRPKWRAEIEGAIQMNSNYEIIGGMKKEQDMLKSTSNE